MGYYVNPANETKEEWLSKHAKEVGSLDLEVTSTKVPVVLIDNGPFTAAGIAYDNAELKVFIDPSDRRSKRYFMASWDDVLEVCPDVNRMR